MPGTTKIPDINEFQITQLVSELLNIIREQSRDTFTSLKKTGRKVRVSFWSYLNDRVALQNQIPRFPFFMIEKLRKAIPVAFLTQTAAPHLYTASSTN